MLIRRNRYLFFQGNIQKRLKNCDYYFFDNNEQIRQVSTLAGNNILKSLKPEYPIIKTNAGRKIYSPIFSVQGLHGSNIDNKSNQIIAVETTMHNTYAIASEKRRG
jgi:hypothetical protein